MSNARAEPDRTAGALAGKTRQAKRKPVEFASNEDAGEGAGGPV
ncbi:MAG TPA: hypothetical protein VEF55_03855 [Candidatus Binatia bacterium]|nr:hypothetical protein [Candidatus Binatia bacterium]